MSSSKDAYEEKGLADKPLNHNASRVFETGASRNSDDGKLDYDGFLCPKVLKSYATYMHKMRYLEDGALRDSDNWQKGIPLDQYRKSMWRHFHSVWSTQRDEESLYKDRVEQLNALLFNVMGMLHEEIKLSEEISKRAKNYMSLKS